MSVTINGTSGLVFNDASTQATAATGFGFKNRILNGNMSLDQRNAGASVTISDSGAGQYTLDRWRFYENTDGVITSQQSSVAPAGFTNSLLVTVTTADASIGSGQIAIVEQKIEGFNTADLAWGTASAQPVTLSFWVRSNLTGTFGGSVRNSNDTRSYPFSYTINSANTFELKTVTIAGDTTGTWLTNNGVGILVTFGLAVGSTFVGTAGSWSGSNLQSATGQTNLLATIGNTFYITGVQLEKGSTATSFDYRPYGTELALCQRYYYKIYPNASNSPFSIGGNYSTTLNRTAVNFPVTMRIAPTALEQTGTASDYAVSQAGIGGTVCSAVPAFSLAGLNFASFNGTVASGLTTNLPSLLVTNSTSSYLAWSAEL